MFPDSLSIFSVLTLFERSTDKEWYNPSGTFSDGHDGSLEQSSLGVGNSKTRTLHQQLTIIYCLMFRLHTVAQERKSVKVYEETQRAPTIPQSDQTRWMFANFYIFNFKMSVGWYHLTKLLHPLTCPKFTVFISPIKPVTDKIWFCFVFILGFLCWLLCTCLNFLNWLIFPLKDFSKLNWKTRSLTKPGNKIINHHKTESIICQCIPRDTPKIYIYIP